MLIGYALVSIDDHNLNLQPMNDNRLLMDEIIKSGLEGKEN